MLSKRDQQGKKTQEEKLEEEYVEISAGKKGTRGKTRGGICWPMTLLPGGSNL